MNGTLTVAKSHAYVEIYDDGDPDRHVILEAVDGSGKRRTLGIGEHRFWIVSFYEQPERGEWALYCLDEEFGLPINRLRGYEIARVLEVAHEDGRRYFE